jgi:hypothetical protein
MARPTSNAPAWLFSFVDLAFLMLIAMTQVAGDPSAPELGELLVPRIDGEAPADLSAEAGGAWQLRVHPPSAAEAGPFELLRPGETAGGDAHLPRLLDREELRERLAALRAEDAPKPLLAPHEDSRSQDMLDAVALLELHWPSQRRALVERVLAAR